MAYGVPLEPKDITGHDLVQVYKLFCVSYGIEPDEMDERSLIKIGLDRLRDQSGLDYRICIGAKFFGQRRGHSTEFWGYSDPEDADREEKDKRFQEAVKEYFQQKLNL